MQYLRDVTRWARPHDAKSKPVDIRLLELWTFSTIESAFVKYLELLNSSNKVDLVAQTFKRVTLSRSAIWLARQDLGARIQNV